MRRFLRSSIRFLLLLAAALAGFPAEAATGKPVSVLPPAERPWIQIQTAHFSILSDASDKRALELGLSLERFRATLAAYHPGFQLDSPQPTLVFVFRNNASYAPYKPRVNGKPVMAEGMFLGEEDLNQVTLSAEWSKDPRPTIYHEFVHEVLRNNLAVVPAWFNEGFAEYFSTYTGDDRHAAIGRPVEEHVGWLAVNSLIPLRQLFTQDYTPAFYTEVIREGVFYAESWALVHYLLGRGNSDERRRRTGDFMDRIQQGQPPEPAFTAAFGTSYEAMEKELLSYVARGAFPVVNLTFSERFWVDATSRISPLPREEALARLGRLLLRLGEDRRPDAEAHFQAALRLDENNALALAGMGRLRAMQGRAAEALDYYEKAAPLLPEDPVVSTEFASLLLERAEGTASPDPAGGPAGGDWGRARDLLKQAIRLRPQYAAAYAELGRTYQRDPGGLAEGIAALEKARDLVPSRIDVAGNLLGFYLQAGKPDLARALYERVIVPSGNSAIAEWARLALEQAGAIRAVTETAPGSVVPPGGASGPPTPSRATEMIEKAAAEATDPEKKRKLEEIASTMKQATPTNVLNEQIKALNQAVALANQRDYRQAIAIMEKVLPDIRDPDLRKQAEQLLARLRLDQQKYPPPGN